MTNLSIRSQLLLATLLPLICIVVFASTFFPLRQQAMGLEVATNEVSMLGEMLAFSVGAGLGEGNYDLVQQAFDWAQGNPNVRYIAILDEDGDAIFDHDPDALSLDAATIIAKEGSFRDGELVLLAAPVTFRAEQLGHVIVGFSLHAFNRELTASLLLALAVNLGLLFGGSLIIWLIARMLSRRVARLRDAAAEVGDGRLDAEVLMEGKDEVAELASAFSVMVGQIRDGRQAIENEKTAVEARVDEAVAASEGERAYLRERVDEMLVAMEAFADGDLTVRLKNERSDEIARLYAGFNRAVESVRNALVRLGGGVENAANTSREIRSATDNLARAAREQSAQADDVAAAIEEMTRTIIDNAQNATGTAEKAESARDRARESSGVVDETITRIKKIAEVVHASVDAVERLGDSSRTIGQIVATINEIADQTNLLALNAAIEAARAGDQGRGFAVVADEVRKLAERTGSATQEIARMIKSVQQETDEAVSAIRDGQDEVERGLALADRAGASMSKIVELSSDALMMTAHVASASEEQSATSEQIARAISSISSTAGQTASGATTIDNAVRDLSDLTSELRTLVAAFRLDSGQGDWLDERTRPVKPVEYA
jgi:methyl-accepting chemotaxis protein